VNGGELAKRSGKTGVHASYQGASANQSPNQEKKKAKKGDCCPKVNEKGERNSKKGEGD